MSILPKIIEITIEVIIFFSISNLFHCIKKSPIRQLAEAISAFKN